MHSCVELFYIFGTQFVICMNQSCVTMLTHCLYASTCHRDIEGCIGCLQGKFWLY